MTRNSLTQNQLKKLLDYNPKTGDFIWKVRYCSPIRVGAVAGCVTDRGYIRINVLGTTYLAHRLAWLYVYGVFPSRQIDHINQQRHDNRIENLREATARENRKNTTLQKNNTSGHVGVSWHAKAEKWRAYLKVKGKQKNLGLFAKKSDAIAARKEASTKFGFHDNHGMPAKPILRPQEIIEAIK